VPHALLGLLVLFQPGAFASWAYYFLALGGMACELMPLALVCLSWQCGGCASVSALSSCGLRVLLHQSSKCSGGQQPHSNGITKVTAAMRHMLLTKPPFFNPALLQT